MKPSISPAERPPVKGNPRFVVILEIGSPLFIKLVIIGSVDAEIDCNLSQSIANIP